MSARTGRALAAVALLAGCAAAPGLTSGATAVPARTASWVAGRDVKSAPATSKAPRTPPTSKPPASPNTTPPAPAPSSSASGVSPALPTVVQLITDPESTPCVGFSTSSVTGVPWPQEYLRTNRVAQLSTGADVTVGLVDNGVRIDARSPMHASVRALPIVAGIPATLAGTPDCTGHGTALASLIASPSGSPVRGIAPDARVVSVQATTLNGATTAVLLARGILAAAAAGAQVIAVPTGTAVPNDALARAVHDVTARGTLVVAPARVDSQQRDAAIYPAQYPEVLSVDDVAANLSAGTSAGQNEPTGADVDVVAPGVAVTAIGPGGLGLVTGSGPSFAVGYAAGAAADVRSRFPELTPAQIVTRLEQTAYATGSTVPDRRFGYGVIDPFAALSDLVGTPPASSAGPPPLGSPSAVSPNGSTRVALLVAGAAALVLVITAGAAASAAAARRRGPRTS